MNSFFASLLAGLIAFFNPHVSHTVVQSLATSTEPTIITSSSSVTTSTSTLVTLKKKYLTTMHMNIKTTGPIAHEIVAPTGFINTDGQPITLGQFKGNKVVLLTFWTFDCINCQRTLPYVNAWYKKYKDQGLEIIGVHTPEFGFEKDTANVEAAVKKDGIQYPVVQDNDYSTWNAYGNRYWPHRYLINVNGEIIYDHIGEGDYDGTEKEIQAALAELNTK